MSREEVVHKGKVIRITPQVVTVSILQHGACSACHAAGLCGMAELSEKNVDVPASLHANYSVGDEVNVVLKASMGFKAVWLAYCIPLLVLLAVVLVLLGLGLGEVPAALCGLGATGLYYLLLWLLRDRLRNEYIFTIKD